MKNSKTQRTGFVICFTTAVLSATLIFLSAVTSGQSESTAAVGQIIKLPAPKLDGPLSLEQTLARRRSIRRFTGQPFTIEQISQLAWSGQGITEKQKGFRTAPSARASYPIRLYLATPKGLFEYLPKEHSLKVILNSDIRGSLSRQQSVAKAGCDVIIIGSVKKPASGSGDGVTKSMLLEAGHIAQNILLQAVSLDLGAVPVGGFNPEEVGKVCKLAENLETLYIIPVGHPAAREEKQEEKN